MSMKAEMNRKMYDAMVEKNFEDAHKNTSMSANVSNLSTGGHDPLSIQEKIKSLQFAKRDNSNGKDTNWFKNMGEVVRGEFKPTAE